MSVIHVFTVNAIGAKIAVFVDIPFGKVKICIKTLANIAGVDNLNVSTVAVALIDTFISCDNNDRLYLNKNYLF